MFMMKTPPRKRKKWNIEVLVFLLVFGLKCSDAQVSEEESSPSDQSLHSTAFFALRSCHQVLGGDGGHFFSPDYLCSNPPLWCNWTIQVHPGKRVHLQLSDLTPDDGCLWRRDQIHIDEPQSQSQKRSILEKCWGEFSYTSVSNTVHVVLLIEGSPTPTYRGFHGQYQAFGPPQVYSPPDPQDLSENMENFLNYIDEETAETNQEDEQGLTTEDQFLPDEPTLATSEVPVLATSEVPVPPSDQTPDQFSVQSSDQTSPTDPLPELRPRGNTAIRRNAEEATNATTAESDVTTGQFKEEMVSQSDDGKQEEGREKDLNPDYKQERNVLPEEKEERTEPHLNHRGGMRAYARYHSQNPHLPGDVLWEVSVEVNISGNSQPWNDEAQTLLHSVKTLIKNQLKPTLVSQSISSKRIKRLHSGVLFILWLQMERSGSHLTHEAVHASLQSLIGSRLDFRENQEDSAIISLSIADVNECDTRLILCDPNADCVNHFGSYSCQCREDFHDQSRSGTGTVCVEMKNTGCLSSTSPEAKAVYVLFFFLSALVLSLLVIFGLFYHRHRRGNFVPSSDPNNNIGTCHHDDIDLPPPPPPRCPPVDLQLLRYNTILSHEPKA